MSRRIFSDAFFYQHRFILIRPALHMALIAVFRVKPHVQNGYTPLMNSAKNGHSAIVKLLLENGANPNDRTKVTCLRELYIMC